MRGGIIAVIDEGAARLALCNLLHRLARRYHEAARAITTDHLKPLFERWSETRASLAAATGLEPAEDDALAAAETADVAARVTAGRNALVELIRAGEAELRDTAEDARSAGIAADLLDRIDTSLAEVSDDLFRELGTLRATWEPAPVRYERSFGLDRATSGIPGLSQPQSRIFDLWYATNRRPIVQQDKVVGYGAERDAETHLGRCGVIIPQAHEIGSTGSPWWRRLSRGDDRLSIDSVEPAEPDDYWASLVDRVGAEAGPGDAVVFLHGYNVSFDGAALRAAQIGADLGLTGPMAFFSWPSRGRILSYAIDEAAIEASEAAITQFLVDVATRSTAARVHLVAHSMGNRGLLRAVNRIAGKAADRAAKPFGQIVLAAPDVDSDLFRDLAGAYGEVGTRTTLYVSAADLAIRCSRLFHGAARIGFTPPVAVIDGIDTVNVTNVDLTLLGHGYVASCRPVLGDMQQLLLNDLPPPQRAFLREIADGGTRHWEIAG